MPLLTLAKHLAGQHDQSKHSGGKGSGFFQGDARSFPIEEAYKGSSKEVQDLAKRTGILATDEKSMAYIKKKYDNPTMHIDTSPIQKPKLVYQDMRDNLIDDMNNTYMGKVTRNADKSFYEMTTAKAGLLYVSSAKKGRTEADVHKSVISSMEELSANLYDAKFPSSAPIGHALPKLTKGEQALMDRLSPHMTKTKGVGGAKMKNELDKLTENERFTVHKIAHKVGARNAVLHIANGVANKHANEKRRAIMADPNLTSSQRADALSKDVDDRRKLNMNLSDTINNNILPIRTKEKVVDYLDRVLNDKNFQDVIPEVIPSSAGNIDFNKLEGLQATSDQEHKDIIGRYSKSWDRGEHKFRGTVNDTFHIIHPEPVKKRWEAAVSEYGNVKSGMYHGTHYGAARGINQTGYRISKGDEKAGKMLGDGVYLANKSSKSMNYIGEAAYQRNTSGVMFENSAAQDTSTNWSTNKNWKRESDRGDFNTVFAGRGFRGFKPSGLGDKWPSRIRNHEWGIKDPGAVLPKIWMDVTID